jgi:hypothetical protein
MMSYLLQLLKIQNRSVFSQKVQEVRKVQISTNKHPNNPNLDRRDSTSTSPISQDMYSQTNLKSGPIE